MKGNQTSKRSVANAADIDVPAILLAGLIRGLDKEINVLVKSGVLQLYHSGLPPGKALNAVLHEFTLRFIAIREFYESVNHGAVTLRTESSAYDTGPIDLVMASGDREYAFEFKMWQSKPEKEAILGKDYEKLMGFMQKQDGRGEGYSVIFTDNDTKNSDPEYIEIFKDLSTHYELVDQRVLHFPGRKAGSTGGRDFLSVCVYLAKPLIPPRAQGE